MNSIFGRYAILVLLLVVGLLFLGAGACSENTRHATLEGNFLQYEDADLVDFNLSGDARCDSCDDDVAGLYIELVSENSPTSETKVGTFEGLGGFHFSNMRGLADSTVFVYGTLFFEDKPESQAMRAQTNFKVPSDDGTASVILQFDQ